MTDPRRLHASSAGAPVPVRRYLSEAGEKEVLRVLREQQQRHKRVTSDDVRLAVRAVASQGGSVAIPPDFPPSRWVLEFKRVHGFVQFNSFTFGAAAPSGGHGVFRLPERLDLAPVRESPRPSATAASQPAAHSSNNPAINGNGSSSSAGPMLVSSSSQSSGISSDGDKEKTQSIHGAPSELRSDAMHDDPPPPYAPSSPPAFDDESQRATQLQRSSSQRHRQMLQQQQRRAMVVDDRRRATDAWPLRELAAAAAEHDQDEMRSDWSRGSMDSENGTTTGPSNSPRGDDASNVRPSMNAIPPHIRHSVSMMSNSADDTQDSVSNASSSNDKRGYKLSHTVPAETWEKAIAAVEQQGMSLRAAAKLYGVHFAALHRRVKKRAQGGQAKGSNGYFHPSDEAGIMRVVVARAELGVLMTFDELMRLVEAAALRKLPDISVDSARKLLTRFQSRTENSIRHIIVDWPPPRPAGPGESGSQQHQPYLEHPGFDFGPKAPVILRSRSAGAASNSTVTAAAMAAAAQKSLFVPPSRLGAPPSRLGGQSSGPVGSNGALLNDRMYFEGPRARSEGDSDAVMVV